MPGSPEYRVGVFASYHGHLYRAGGSDSPHGDPRITLIREAGLDPVPEGLTPHELDPERVYWVGSPDQLDAWYRSKWTFRWHDEPFQAAGSVDGKIGGTYIGSRRWLVQEYLTRVEAAVFEGTFPLDEVTDLVEDRTDLLAQWRVEHEPTTA